MFHLWKRWTMTRLSQCDLNLKNALILAEKTSKHFGFIAAR
jgi:hypothetical protein